MTADPAVALKFLKKLFAGTSHDIEIRALPSKARIFTRNPEKVRRFLERHAGQNLYFGAATRNGGGTKSHCKSISVLWIDIDFKTMPEEEARKLVLQFPTRPSVIVASGGGVHLY